LLKFCQKPKQAYISRDGFVKFVFVVRLAGVYCGSAPYFTPIRQKSFDLMGIED
jgi:hypothetical protein